LRVAAQPQATDALIVNFARRQWGDLAGSPCEIVAVHLYRGIEFRPNEIGLAAKARLSEDLLPKPETKPAALARCYHYYSY
jgi:hypothetical protein